MALIPWTSRTKWIDIIFWVTFELLHSDTANILLFLFTRSNEKLYRKWPEIFHHFFLCFCFSLFLFSGKKLCRRSTKTNRLQRQWTGNYRLWRQLEEETLSPGWLILLTSMAMHYSVSNSNKFWSSLWNRPLQNFTGPFCMTTSLFLYHVEYCGFLHWRLPECLRSLTEKLQKGNWVCYENLWWHMCTAFIFKCP